MRCATRRTDAPGTASRMQASSLVHAWENPWATVRMAQLCSVMRQLPSREALRFRQIAVLVEDVGQCGDLFVEGEVGGLGTAGDTSLAPLFEELVDLGCRPVRPGTRGARS